jgi:hypothetical protein
MTNIKPAIYSQPELLGGEFGRLAVRCKTLRDWAANSGRIIPETDPPLDDYEGIALEAFLSALVQGVRVRYGIEAIDAAVAAAHVSPAVSHSLAEQPLPKIVRPKINRILLAAKAIPDLEPFWAERIEEGNYTSALHRLGTHTATQWRELLRAAVASGELPTVDAETGAETATSAESAPAAAPPQRREKMATLQDAAVLAALRELGHDPLNLPPFKPGKASEAKRDAQAKLKYTPSTMGHAWQRLLDEGLIRYR